jgi:glycolate oxidase
VLDAFRAGEILFADSEAQKSDLWHIRRNAGNAMIQLTQDRVGEDTVVPRAALPMQLSGANAIAAKHQVKISSLGHLGDGNMHIYLVNEEEDPETWLPRAMQAKREIFALTKSLNGMLSAEHGVGLAQKPFMDMFFGATHLSILRGIKNVFDPKGILNPGKVIPDETLVNQ